MGREAAFGLSLDANGQCTNNSATGSWFSLPQLGECASPFDVVGRDCTWRADKLIKTINASCLLTTQHFLSFCDSSMPLTAAADALTVAFASDVLADGGCPQYNK